MKHLIQLLSILLLLSCNENSNQNKETNTTSEPEERPSLQEDLMHYWDDFPYADPIAFTDSAHISNMLLRWIDALTQLPDSDVQVCARTVVTAGGGSPSGQKSMFQWLEKYLNDPNSPVRNEELFIPVLQAFTEDSIIDEIDKVRPRFLLSQAMKNRKGTKATDIDILLTDGSRKHLYDVCTPLILIYFFNPDCHDCKRVGGMLAEEPIFQQLQQQGRLTILAIYPDEDLTSWQKYQGTFPREWITGRLDKAYERDKYVLPAIPSLYLLDSSHIVLLKDATIEMIMHRLS